MTPEDFYVGQTLHNGALVIACRKRNASSWAILALQPDASALHDPYVTWVGFPEGGISWGHYHRDLNDAVKNYNTR